MSTKTRHYFVNGIAAQGFIDYFASNLQDLETVTILKGGPGTGKSRFILSVAAACENKGLELEYIHCPFDPNTLDGVIVPDLKYAIVDGTAPHCVEPAAPGAIEEYVNLAAAWDSTKLKAHKDDILNRNRQISACYENAQKCFAEGLAVHDEWEKIYIKNMDFAKADKLTAETIELLLGDKRLDKAAATKTRFFGTSTPSGSFDYVESLTAGIPKRYFLKGRPGTGKSTLLKKLVTASTERGFDTEVYHCGFDANSLDMVILPELNVCIFDSTAPHLYEPTRTSDEIIDLYTKCVKSGTDEKYRLELLGISARYKIAVQRGTRFLADAKKLHDELKMYYMEAIDRKKVDALCDEEINKLQILMEQMQC